MDETAAEVSRRGLEMFMETGGRTAGSTRTTVPQGPRGRGCAGNAAPATTGAALMAYVAIGELIHVEPVGFLRSGRCLSPRPAWRNVHAGGAVYEAELGEGLRVRCDGQAFLDCSTRAIVRLPLAAGDAPILITAVQGDWSFTMVTCIPTPRDQRSHGVCAEAVGWSCGV